MAKELSVEEAIARARRVQDDRIESIRGLAEARQKVADVREQAAQRVAEVQRETANEVAVAEREDVARYSAAQAAGWSVDELRKIGYGEPDKKVRVRKRAARKPSAPVAEGVSSVVPASAG